MADITPITNRATTGYTNGQRDGVFFDPPAATPTAGNSRRRVQKMRQLTFYLPDWSNAEVLRAPAGTIAAAYQGNTLTDIGVLTIDGTGVVFNTAATTPDGWVHFLVSGATSVGTSTNAAAARGTAGHVNPYRGIFLNHRSATPDTLVQNRVTQKARLRLQIYPIVSAATSDRWRTTTLGLCPGIVAVAWQGNTTLAANRAAVTLDAAGDVIITRPSGSATGFLWVWRAR